jgi:hypothetical protein
VPALCRADAAADFDAAAARWKASGLRTYSFEYQYDSGDVVAPYCATATIWVRVIKGTGTEPVVVKGSRHCPVGTRGRRSIDVAIPETIDAVFDTMRRYVHNPPTPVEVKATLDSKYGFPTLYFVSKLEVSDSDEGFRISNFSVQR